MRSLFVLALLGAHGAVAAQTDTLPVTPEIRQRAEDLAGAASQRFSDILDKRQEVAQSDTGKQGPAAATPGEPAGALAPLWNWLARAAQSYDDVVITQLKKTDGWAVIVQRSADATPAPVAPQPAASEAPPSELRGWNGLTELLRDWLARANRSYRNEIVKPLKGEPPLPDVPSETAAQPPAAAPPVAPQGVPPTVAPPSPPAAGGEEIKQQAEAADAKRKADEEEAERKAEADLNRVADEAAVKLKAEAEAKRKSDVEQKRVAAEAARAKAKRDAEAAEAKRRADAQAERVAEEAAARRKAEVAETKRKAEVAAEAKRKADAEAKRQSDEADAAERKAVAEAEAETKRKAEIEAEATRRSAVAARAKEAERAKQAAGAKVATAPALRAPAPAAVGENSAVAVAPATPEKKPGAPAPKANETVVPKSREDTSPAEAPPPPMAKKTKRAVVALSHGKRQGQVHSKRHKKAYAHKHHRKSRHGVHARRRVQAAPYVVVRNRCACRCGSVYAKPRKRRHAAWTAESGMRWGGHYQARPHKHRGGRLTYRHRGYYIR
jgi:hypothetical protein